MKSDLERLVAFVCKTLRVDSEQMLAGARGGAFSRTRHIIATIGVQCLHASRVDVAKALHVNHLTVAYGLQRCRIDARKSDAFARQLASIAERFLDELDGPIVDGTVPLPLPPAAGGA